MRIPCDTIARLSHLLPAPDMPKVDDALASIRLDNGMVIVTNRMFMAVEEVEPFNGVFYIRPDPNLIEQCRIEAQYSSVIEFTPVPAMKWTTAITTLGYSVSENIGYWPDGPSDYDKWRELILDPCLKPLDASTGPMILTTQLLSDLARAAPSGDIILEQYVDPRNRPVTVRDINASNWVGFFKPWLSDGKSHVGASVPGWCR